MDLFFLILLVPIILAALIIGWGLRFGRRRARSLRIDEMAYPGLVRLRSTTLVARRLGLALGILACLAVLPLGYLGRFALTAPALAGIVTIIALLVGQYSVQRAATTPGVAGLERRSWTDYPSRRSVSMIVAMVGLAALAAGYTAYAASPDDLGRTGRALRTVCSSTEWVEGTTIQQFSERISAPFPGSYYTAPMAFAIVMLALTVIAALVMVGRRPRDGSDAELVRVDDALRRMTAEGIVASAGLGVGGSLVLVAGSAYPQFGNAACTTANVAASYVFALVALGSLMFCLRCLVTIIVPGDGTPP